MNVDLVIEYVTRHDLILMIFGQGKWVLCMRKERVTFKRKNLILVIHSNVNHQSLPKPLPQYLRRVSAKPLWVGRRPR